MPVSTTFSSIERLVSSYGATLALVVSSACGYAPLRGPGAQPNGPTAVFIEPISEKGAFLDAAAQVEAAFALAVARHPAFVMSVREGCELSLRVQLLNAAPRFTTLSEPALRPVRYVMQVELQVEAIDAAGEAVWQQKAAGRAMYVSPVGPLETLDGAGRRALAQAASDAAERVLAALARAP